MALQNNPSKQKTIEYPKLIPVEIFPIVQDGQRNICLRDPRQIAKNVLVIPPQVFFILSMFDGNHSLLDIQETIMRQSGQLIRQSDLQGLIEKLDSEYYLESDTFIQAFQSLEQEYRNAAYREAAHAGSVYERYPDKLRLQLGRFIHSLPEDPNPAQDKHVSLLIAPHIDFHRGGPCFAHAYRELKKSPPADLYLIFGTGHHCIHSQFAFTRKSYNTPLGWIETDVEFVDRIASQAGEDIFQEELMHKNEHSVEFQMVWLRYVLGSDWRGKAAPVLCGSFHEFIQEGTSPRGDASVANMLDLIRNEIEAYPGRITIVAGVDLSHVGRQFGQEEGIPEPLLKQVDREDREMLDEIRSGSAERFFRSVEKIKDRNNVCGLSSIYVALDLVRPREGVLLSYDKSIDHETESMVSFASVTFYD